MFDTLIPIVAAEAATVIVTLILAALGTVGTLALDQLRKFLGEKRTADLRAILEPAVQRAIKRAEAQGLTGESITDSAVAYLTATMSGTLKALGATPEALRKRVSAEQGGKGK